MATSKATQTEFYSYDYDHAGRLVKTRYKLGTSGNEIVLAENTYDELGRLKTSKKNNQANLISTYTYNVRSWMKSSSSPLFSQTLYYNDSYGNNTPRYNGNISAMSWTTSGDKTRGYTFSYDNLSRLTKAGYLEAGASNASYSTSYAYDKHGNMTNLLRNGRTGTTTFGTIDNLSMIYAGNQLIKADDAGTNVTLSASMDFKNNFNAAKEYYYDLNGNLTKDLNKGITGVTYNLLNLPRSITINNALGQGINTYTYAADGRKLQAVIGDKTTYYVGNMIYENGSLKRILIDGGYIEGGAYYFYLTDHLGNNRVVANANGGIVQTNHYYPFGMSFAEGVSTSKQPYKYNGKELDTEKGLNLYDYSARLMDPVLGRFSTVDPKAEKYYGISPYVYCANNPMRFIDPDGREIWVSYKDDVGNQQRIQYIQGTDYKGSNAFVQNTFSYLNAINDNGGSDMLSVLSSSKNSFDFVNQPTTDKKGNVIDKALNFDGNKSGGGTIYAGALMGSTSEYSKVESTAHELFHGLQQEEGQGGASVYNEVEANVYSSNITMNWSYKTNYVGGMSGNGLGDSTPAGAMYQQSFSNLTNGFSNSDFVNAIKSFKGGSEKNSTGLYNTYPLRRSNQIKSILQQFYPMKR